jgi:hypothetical protein
VTVVRCAVVSALLVGMASCGSRTGLFLPELSTIPDATRDADVTNVRDARAEADALPDVRDATIDAIDDGPLPCVSGTFTLNLASPQLMFVMDRSGSMEFALDSTGPPAAGQPTRWTVLRDALGQTIIPFTDQIAMGARFYPIANADPFDNVEACSQDPPSRGIVPALGNADAILRVFDDTPPVGGTPTAMALQAAARQLSASRAVARAMVVATDGVPNCNAALDRLTCTCTARDPDDCRRFPTGATNCLDDVRTIATLESISQDNKIPVYVVGIGVTSAFSATLDAMAVAGGRPRSATPKYYPAETPGDLISAFTVVRDSVAKCSYITTSSPTDPDAISVKVAGRNVARDPNRINGWDWIDQAYGHLQLFGAACALATPTNVVGTISCDDDQ